MKFILSLGVAAASLVAASAVAASAPVTDIHQIPLKDGINRVARFAADGRTATIVKAWRGNGNAHGYDIFLVTLPGGEGRAAGLVGVDDPSRDPLADTIRDNPFDGERTMGEVVFARARLKGVQQTILIQADLDPSPSGVFADHSTATIQVYRLKSTDGEIGETPDHFVPAWKTKTSARYCNVDLALRDVLGIPLPKDYSGANQKDGCGD